MRVAAVAALGAAVLAASLAGAASAAPPAWHYCGKALTKNTGNYTDKGCSVASAPGQGKYELFTGVGKGKGFKGKGPGGLLDVVIPHETELRIECAKSSLEGHPVAPSGVAGVTVAFSKCTFFGTASCGTITTSALSGQLGWLDRETGTAGISLTSEMEPGSGLIAQGACTLNGKAISFRVKGAVIGAMPASSSISKEHTVTYSLGQYLETENVPTNPPAFEEGLVGILQTELKSPESKEEWTPEGGLPSGFEAHVTLKGEALSVF
jgi:hypothetical protein